MRQDSATPGRGKGTPRRVLLAMSDAASRESWTARIAAAGFEVRAVPTLAEARRLLSAAEFAAMLVDQSLQTTLCKARQGSGPQVILLAESPDPAAMIEAFRQGTGDIFLPDIDDKTLRERLERAAARSAADREATESTRRLRHMCRKLTEAVHESEERIDSLSRDVAKLAEDATARISEAALAAEFRTLLSQELDVEALLRTALQYLLKKTGPTNAAVFLPDAEQHFSLGAYVNYDCQREAADLLLEHVCGSICPHLCNEESIIRFEDGDELAELLGEQAAIIKGRDVIAFRCAHHARTFAILLLFRDRNEAFGDDLPSVLETLRPIFAAQLESILRVHHRARPQWPGEAAEDVAESDDDFGFGIAA